MVGKFTDKETGICVLVGSSRHESHLLVLRDWVVEVSKYQSIEVWVSYLTTVM